MVLACNMKRKYRKDKGSNNPIEKISRGRPKKRWKDKMNMDQLSNEHGETLYQPQRFLINRRAKKKREIKNYKI